MLRRIFSHSDVPVQYRSNFLHLYMDIGWFGVLAGSAANFLGVYLTRLGASASQLGFLSAVGAVVSLILAIPAGRWLESRPIGCAVFWTSIAQRLFYLFWVPLPWFLGAQGQVWMMIALAFLMAIPASALNVGFNALFAAAVPPEWRAPVAGIRNVALSVTFMAASLGSGYILDHLAFPSGYQVVFAIGAVGALMSSLHLFFIKPLPSTSPLLPLPARSSPATPRLTSALRTDIWRSPYSRILGVMLVFTLAVNLALPLFPIFFVRNLGLSDVQIGVGTAVFYLSHLLGSTQLARLTRRFGNHRLTAVGSMALCLYPIIISLAQYPSVFFVMQTLNGVVWSVVGGAQANYLLENIPGHDRPAYLAWYSVISNLGVLAGTLAGPLISDLVGISLALFFFGLLRLVGGWAILRWGAGRPLESS